MNILHPELHTTCFWKVLLKNPTCDPWDREWSEKAGRKELDGFPLADHRRLEHGQPWWEVATQRLIQLVVKWGKCPGGVGGV